MRVTISWNGETGRQSMTNDSTDTITCAVSGVELRVEVSGIERPLSVATKTISVVEEGSSPILPRRDGHWSLSLDGVIAFATFQLKRSGHYNVVHADGTNTNVLFHLD